MNKELLQQKAEALNEHFRDSFNPYILGFLAGAKEILDNPELYDLVKKDRYDKMDAFYTEECSILEKENKEIKEKYEELYVFYNDAKVLCSLQKVEVHDLEKENKELKESYEIFKYDSEVSIQQYWSSQNEIKELKEKIEELENRIEEIGYDAIDASERE